MSTLYLIDAHNPVGANAHVDGIVVDPDSNGVPINGSYVVSIPDFVSIGKVSTVSELESAKEAALLATYPGFSNILFQSNSTAPSLSAHFGEVGDRMTTTIRAPFVPYFAISQSTVIALASSPTQAVFLWDVFEIVESIEGNRVVRKYFERPKSDLTANLSFNGGADFQTVTYGEIFTIPFADQGNQFQVGFFHDLAVGEGRWIEGWALIY